MCLVCGFYKGRQVMDLKAEHEKRAARIKAKKERIRAQDESIAGSDAEAVSEATPAENTEEEKK